VNKPQHLPPPETLPWELAQARPPLPPYACTNTSHFKLPITNSFHMNTLLDALLDPMHLESTLLLPSIMVRLVGATKQLHILPRHDTVLAP
jgi:hypothetical protein